MGPLWNWSRASLLVDHGIQTTSKIFSGCWRGEGPIYKLGPTWISRLQLWELTRLYVGRSAGENHPRPHIVHSAFVFLSFFFFWDLQVCISTCSSSKQQTAFSVKGRSIYSNVKLYMPLLICTRSHSYGTLLISGRTYFFQGPLDLVWRVIVFWAMEEKYGICSSDSFHAASNNFRFLTSHWHCESSIHIK